MRLSSQKWLLFLLVSTVACHDSTGPSTLNAQFDLTDIDGRPLPTYPSTTPGLTPTVLAQIVTLNDDGTAVIFEHRKEFDGTDATFQSNYTYQIHNSTIAFDFHCPADADCIAPPEGTIFGNRLSLVMGRLDNVPIVYNYTLKPAEL
jgi:hypothetical protein